MGASLVAKLSDDIQIPEARCFFGFQIMQRNIHEELFTVMLDMFTEGFSDRDAILESVKDCTLFFAKKTQPLVSAVQAKKAWVERYITDSCDHFSVRVLASAVYNYMFQAVLIDALLHVAKVSELGGQKPSLPGLLRSLSKFQRDQRQYFSFFGNILDILKNKPKQALAERMVTEVMSIESMLLDNLLNLSGGSVQLSGTDVNPTLIKERLKMHANICLTSLGFRAPFEVKDPLPWIHAILTREAKKDDVEHGIQMPSKASAAPKAKKQAMETLVFSLSEDF